MVSRGLNRDKILFVEFENNDKSFRRETILSRIRYDIIHNYKCSKKEMYDASILFK